jgi:hypothetical protein
MLVIPVGIPVNQWFLVFQNHRAPIKSDIELIINEID